MIGLKGLVLILANVIHHEARSEDYKTKVLVASVVMERVVLENSDIQTIVYSPKAFSNFKLYAPTAIEDITSFKESKAIAENILHGRLKVTKGYRFFNDKKLGVRYKTKAKPIYTANLVFY